MYRYMYMYMYRVFKNSVHTPQVLKRDFQNTVTLSSRRVSHSKFYSIQIMSKTFNPDVFCCGGTRQHPVGRGWQESRVVGAPLATEKSKTISSASNRYRTLYINRCITVTNSSFHSCTQCVVILYEYTMSCTTVSTVYLHWRRATKECLVCFGIQWHKN